MENTTKLKSKEDLNVYMENANSLYKDISVDKYIKESRRERHKVIFKMDANNSEKY